MEILTPRRRKITIVTGTVSTLQTRLWLRKNMIKNGDHKGGATDAEVESPRVGVPGSAAGKLPGGCLVKTPDRIDVRPRGR